MESQWIVELTSSGRVDAVKKGPFPLIIYFPIRHCPARGKHTFISGTLFCEPSNQEPVHSSIVSMVNGGWGGAWRIDRPWLSLHDVQTFLCLSGKLTIFSPHMVFFMSVMLDGEPCGDGSLSVFSVFGLLWVLIGEPQAFVWVLVMMLR